MSAGLNAPADFGEDEDEGGMVTGAGSNDTVGPTRAARRRRRREPREMDEDDSSDLSDESDEADEPQTYVPYTALCFPSSRGSVLLNSSSSQRCRLDIVLDPHLQYKKPDAKETVLL